MKGDIKPDHIGKNKYQMLVRGTLVPFFTFTEISGAEEELESNDMPDKTVVSGGRTLPTEFTAMCPMHHLLEQLALEAWFQEGKDPVSPFYKKGATMVYLSGSGLTIRAYTYSGTFITKRKLPDSDMDNSGELALSEWTFKADEVIPHS